MSRYSYSALDSEAGQIRIVRLLPGLPDEPLKVGVIVAQISRQPAPGLASALELKEVESTLPKDWAAYRTAEGRYLFRNQVTFRTSWQHPEPSQRIISKEFDREAEKKCATETPEFEALSYVWGDRGSQETIFARDILGGDTEDVGPECTLDITSNLASALRHLRHESTPRDLWIDAICINQGDNDEKTRQITLLRDIFLSAQNVIIWLGESSADSALALSTLEGVADGVELLNDWIVWDSSQSNQPWTPLPTVTVPPLSDEGWRAVSALLSRPWFGRVWVMQEAAAAGPWSVVQCGHEAVSWYAFRRAIALLLCGDVPACDAAGAREDTFQKLVNAGDIANQSSTGDFLTTLMSGKRKLASDPRDKIYGILGLSPTWFVDALRPDYRKSLPEVYISAIKAYVETTGDLDILLYCEADTKLENGPSWAPNLNAVKSPLCRGSTVTYNKCFAAPKFSPSNILTVDGVFCGTVTDVSARLTMSSGDFGRVVTEFETKHCHKKGSKGDIVRDLVTTLARGFVSERWPERNSAASHVLQESYLDGDFEKLLHQMAPRPPREMALMAVSTGHIGLANPSAKPGDKIYFLVGSSKPLILRQSLSKRFEIVGDCYVDHLEHEQALLGPLPSHQVAQTVSDANGWRIKQYLDIDTGKISSNDPRLHKQSSHYILSSNGEASEHRYHRKGQKDRSAIRHLRASHETIRARGVHVEAIEVM